MQVRYAASHVQHMQKALEQMNVKLTEVVSDITGVTGLSIIDAILGGERDPMELAKRRDQRCHHSEALIALALEGTWRPEHLFELRQARALYQFHHQQISECDEQVAAERAKFADRAGGKTRTGKPRKRGHKSNDVRFEATGPLFQALGVDLTLIEGIDVGTALVILAEIGVDVSRFPTEKHFASWLRLCPPQDQSNGTKKHRRHRKGTNRVAIALRMAARSVGRTMTPLGLFYRRIKSRTGGLGAVKATAHKLACLVYRMLKYGQEYVTQTMEDYEAKLRAKMLDTLSARRRRWASNSIRCPRDSPVDRGRHARATGLGQRTTRNDQLPGSLVATPGERGRCPDRQRRKPPATRACSPKALASPGEFMGSERADSPSQEPAPAPAGRVGPAVGKPWRPWRSAGPTRPATATTGPAAAGTDEEAHPREVSIFEAR